MKASTVKSAVLLSQAGAAFFSTSVSVDTNGEFYAASICEHRKLQFLNTLVAPNCLVQKVIPSWNSQ